MMQSLFMQDERLEAELRQLGMNLSQLMPPPDGRRYNFRGDDDLTMKQAMELMDELRQLDEVAYVRFASVYRHFEDVEAFHEEIQRLRSQRSPTPPGREGRRSSKREPGRDANRDQLPLLPPESPGKSDTPDVPRSDHAGSADASGSESASAVPATQTK